MKIAIMSWFQYHNYGTALQITALSQWLKNHSYEPYIINYKSGGKAVFRHTHTIVHDAVTEFYTRFKNHPYHRYEERTREGLFEEFLEKNIKFTKECVLMSDLESLNSEFDAFICGSDQIWSPNGYNPHYFLDFVMESEKMIAYAPSVGLPRINDKNVKTRMMELTSRFNHLSTREKQGSQIISQLINRAVETVLDPTLLLTGEEWSKLVNDYAHNFKPYMLVYMLGNTEAYWKEIYKIAERLNLEVRIVPAFFRDLNRKGCCSEAIGPAEFLSLVQKASYVATDSFHGMVFAINFHKNFCVFERFGRNYKLNQNSRIYNILELTGLQNRLYKQHNLDTLTKSVDYHKVDKVLQKERDKSEEFLFKSLNDAKTYNQNNKQQNNILSVSSICCGCGACYAVCPKGIISIPLNKDGFYQIDIKEDECVSCGKCVKVCPYLNTEKHNEIKEAKLFSYISNDRDVLQTSSSGGFGDALVKTATEKHAEVAGCIFDPYEHRAKHIILSSSEEKKYDRLRGSKYIQSEFSPIMKMISKMPSGSIVIGTPCQIAGVRSILRKNSNVLLVDLICHGVPTYNLYRKYLKYIERRKNIDTQHGLETIFRYKKHGWRERYIYNDNFIASFYESQNKDPYFLAFEHGFCYAKSCYECPWRDKSAADLRIGDYWHKRYNKNDTGVSMVAALTPFGVAAIKNIEQKDIGIIKEEEIQDYFECQQTENNPRPAFWEEFIEELCGDGNLETILDRYVMPFETRKKIRNIASKLGELVKND